MKPILLAALIVTTLAGCAAAPAPSMAVDVAGVIAPYKADWIEASTTQSDCVQAWVFDKATGPACYVLADSVDSSTAIALQKLEGMTAPAERELDFTALQNRLKTVTGLKIRAVCGTTATPDTSMEACADLIVERTRALGALDRELTKWP